MRRPNAETASCAIGHRAVVHATAAARARVREQLGFGGLGAAVIPGLGLCRRHVEQAARLGDVIGARAAGEQAIMANAEEAVRQDLDQESIE